MLTDRRARIEEMNNEAGFGGKRDVFLMLGLWSVVTDLNSFRGIIFKELKRFAAISALLLAVLACRSSAPFTMEDLEVFPGATPLEAGQNNLADTLADSIRESAGVEGVEVEVQMYNLPPETAWAGVKSFYMKQTDSGDWQADESLLEETEVVSMAGWTRGGLASEQALLIAFTDDPFGGQPFLIVMLFSE